MVQVVLQLPSKSEVLSLNPSSTSSPKILEDHGANYCNGHLVIFQSLAFSFLA
jgi:hypothetical protein